ncbi:MAG: hypothetical protein CME06_14190 [Gemmatimonadetes bacterium]|nr:hypothetical protein [Gemmatimonadota bacterium]
MRKATTSPIRRREAPSAFAAPILLALLGLRPASAAPATASAQGTLHLELLDELRRPTAARVYVTGSDGESHQPQPSIHRTTQYDDEPYYYVARRARIDLPPGDALIEISRGFEYRLRSLEVSIVSGVEQTVRVDLTRWIDMPAQGWYSGDGHVHMNYGGPIHRSPPEGLLMLIAEDVHYGNMVVANKWGSNVIDDEYFTGAVHPLSRPRHIMRWNEEFRNDGLLGHMSLYALTELTDPVYTGFGGSDQPYDFPLNADIADQVAEQGGYVTGAHPSVFLGEYQGGEHLICIALGKMSGLEIMGYGAFTGGARNMLHLLWNAGFRTVPTAGTDSFLNSTSGDPVGGARCYARIDGEFNDESWLDAVRAGRTLVTNGPGLSLSVDGHLPGDVVYWSTGDPPLSVWVEAASPWRLSEVDLVIDGVVVSRERDDKRQLSLSADIVPEKTGWIEAACSGPPGRFVFGGGIFRGTTQLASTAPVWVVVDGQAHEPFQAAVTELLGYVDGFIEEARTVGVYANQAQRDHMEEIYATGRQVYVDLLADRSE